VTKTVAIFTNYRTGSTAFTLLKSEEYDLPYGAELFSHERQSRVGSIPSRHELQRDYKIWQYELCDLIQSTDNLTAELKKKDTEICFKIMPTQVSTIQDNINIANAVDKVYFLYSRNFIRTVKSWIAVRVDGGFASTGFKSPSRRYDIEKTKEIHLGRQGHGETHISTIDPKGPKLTGQLGQVSVNSLRKNIIENYERMAEIYHAVGGELICMEEYFTEDKFNPYNKKIIWTEEPIIEDFDVESLFAIDIHNKL
jgi:hypothetical protein|tara:strand:+ start:308 stop:1069 length:762 start_codon:yes stop_codon:yes gene_type:complete